MTSKVEVHKDRLIPILMHIHGFISKKECKVVKTENKFLKISVVLIIAVLIIIAVKYLYFSISKNFAISDD